MNWVRLEKNFFTAGIRTSVNIFRHGATDRLLSSAYRPGRKGTRARFGHKGTDRATMRMPHAKTQSMSWAKPKGRKGGGGVRVRVREIRRLGERTVGRGRNARLAAFRPPSCRYLPRGLAGETPAPLQNRSRRGAEPTLSLPKGRGRGRVSRGRVAGLIPGSHHFAVEFSAFQAHVHPWMESAPRAFARLGLAADVAATPAKEQRLVASLAFGHAGPPANWNASRKGARARMQFMVEGSYSIVESNNIYKDINCYQYKSCILLIHSRSSCE